MQYLFFLTTAILTVSLGINYKVSAAVLFVLGTGLVWLCSYQAITGLIYSRGKYQIIIPIIQTVLVGGGFGLLVMSKGNLTIFGYQMTAVQYGYAALSSGLLLGVTSRPPLEEIEATGG